MTEEIISANCDWDDTEIINIFNEAVKSHRTKNNQNNETKKQKSGDGNIAEVSTEIQQTDSKGKKTHKKRKFAADSTVNTYMDEERKEILNSSVLSNDTSPLVGIESLVTSYSSRKQANRNDIDNTTSQKALHTAVGSNDGTIPLPGADQDIPATIDGDAINNSLTNMLMAWYQSGYATGYYAAEQKYLSKS